MIRIFTILFAFLTLSACSAGDLNPWGSAPQTAQSEPSQLEFPAMTAQAPVLTPPAAAPNVNGMPLPEMPQSVALSSSSPPVKVGLLVPLSGKSKDLGQGMLQAAQLALFDIGYDSFEIIPRDTADGKAASAAQSALAEGAQLILGPVFAPDVQAAKPVVEAAGINMIAFSTDWNLAGGNTYILGFLPFVQVQRVLEYARRDGVTRLGILAPDNSYGRAVMASAQSVAARLGIIVTQTMSFPASGTNLTTAVKSFTRYDERQKSRSESGEITAPLPFDAVLIPVGGEQARTIASLLSYYDMTPGKVRRLGTGLWDDPALAREPALDGGWYAAAAPEQRAGFENRYRDLYGGATPPRLSTLAYDATALAAVLARNGYATMSRPAFDRASLVNPNGFAGLDGVFRFRPDGLAERGLAVMEFDAGRIDTIESAPRTFQGWISQ